MKQIDMILLADNIKESDVFYRDILGLEIQYDWESMIIYKNRFAIHQRDLLKPADFAKSLETAQLKGSDNLIIYLEIDKSKTLEQSLKELKAKNVTFIHDIVQLPWQRIFRIKDPDGNIVEIGEEH